jgi:hypothetical protein
MFDPVALGLPPQTSIQIAWIDLAENEAKSRMLKRADPRDEWKLAHWDQYAKRRTEPPAHMAIHRFNHLHFDEIRFNKLIEKLV